MTDLKLLEIAAGLLASRNREQAAAVRSAVDELRRLRTLVPPWRKGPKYDKDSMPKCFEPIIAEVWGREPGETCYVGGEVVQGRFGYFLRNIHVNKIIRWFYVSEFGSSAYTRQP